MLHELSIADLGVIDRARLEFSPALTCVTGETGVGKTMILTGLGLILGDKAVPATVRAGAEQAFAEAIVDLPDELAPRLDEAGVTVEDDGTVVVSRQVGAKRSKAVIGGRTVPQALLSEIADELVTVHGQSDQVRLRGAARQRALLDEYAGAAHRSTLEAYRAAWSAWQEARAEAERLTLGADAARAEAARMRDDLAAIDEVDPHEGEDDELAVKVERLENVEALRASAATAHEVLDGDDAASVAQLLGQVRRALEEASRHDQTLAGLEGRVAEHAYGLADVALELSAYLHDLDASPGELDDLHARRSALAGLMRRIGSDLPGVLEYAERARVRVAEDDAWDETLARVRAAERDARAALQSAADAVTASRRDAAAALMESVTRELRTLAMPDSRVEIEVEAREPGPSGADTVTLLLAAHPGAPLRPIVEAASGGELSRIMLAIEVSLAATSQRQRTFVFDEVDAGIGGKAAQAVGERLAVLARTHQVVVVTHLAQVAARADAHVVARKATDGATTATEVVEVRGEARVAEIARLLSGAEDSETARAHAQEMLDEAAA